MSTRTSVTAPSMISSGLLELPTMSSLSGSSLALAYFALGYRSASVLLNRSSSACARAIVTSGRSRAMTER